MAVDANFANVSLLLHMDGVNNSPVFADSAPSPKLVYAFGDAKISTAQSKFGGASGAFDGTGDYLAIPSSADFEFGSGNATVELWFRATAAPATAGGLIQRPNASGYANFSLNYRPSGALEAYCSLSNPASIPVILAPTGVITIGQWHHIAFVKNGLVYTLYVDGVSRASGTAASHPPTGLTTQTYIGALSPTTFFVNGHIDDLRVTKGVARYTSNFTPPAAPFPDGAFQVSGTVLDGSGSPVARTVRAYRRDTGALIGSTTSDGSTGAYAITSPTSGEVQVICLDDDADTLENDLIHRAIPV